MPTEPARAPTPVPAPSASKPRVLICDDSRIVRKSIGQHLRDRFEMREVTDGEAAWQAILLDSSIRVVISDLTMPKVNGFELLNRVRSSKVQRIRELPLVIISGEEEGAERERAATLGATDFIQKSVGAAELLARMEVLVRLSTTREALAESQASLESSRTVDADTELLNQPFFDKQVEKLISFARRNLSDVALICIRVELSVPQKESWEGETDQRMKLVGPRAGGVDPPRRSGYPHRSLRVLCRHAVEWAVGRAALRCAVAQGAGEHRGRRTRRRGLDLHRAVDLVGRVAAQRRGTARAGAKARRPGAAESLAPDHFGHIRGRSPRFHRAEARRRLDGH